MSYAKALSTLGCPELSLPEVLALAKKHGLAAVELRALGGMLDLPRHLADNFPKKAKLLALVKASGVKIAALDTSLKLIGNTEADREDFLRFVPWAEALGVPQLRVFDGGKTFDEDALEQAMATIGWWQGLKAKHRWNTKLMVETHDCLTTTDAILRFAEVAPNCGILWDSHHTWKKGGENPVQTWSRIKEHVVHIHVKDSVSKPSARHPFTYVLLGEGEFPAAPLFAVLRDEYRGTVSLEWEKQWHPYLPPVDVALEKAAERGWW